MKIFLELLALVLIIISLTGFSSVEANEKIEYCGELLPQCSCDKARDIMRCDNFDDFSEIDFTKLINEPDEEFRIINEFELKPKKMIMLDDTLVLNKIKLNRTVILRNIDGFDMLDNSFRDAVTSNRLRLEIYESVIRTEEEKCKPELIEEDFQTIFSHFYYILFGDEVDYTDEFCPLIFYRTDISIVEITDIQADDYLTFNDFKVEGYNLSAEIDRLRIRDSYDVLISQKLLNEYVFEYLATIDLNNVRLAKIEDDSFFYIQNLKFLVFQIENWNDFISASDNKWLTNLNRNVKVNVSDPQSVSENLEKSLVFIINSQTSNQNYTFPNEHLDNWKNFPYQRFVIPRIEADKNIDCTVTMRYLLQYSQYYPNLIVLVNTSSTEKCFSSNCPELLYCDCQARTDLKCEYFDAWSDLDFSLLNNQAGENRRGIINFELKPRNQIMIDNTLKLTKIELQDNIVLRNLDGFDLLANPFFDSAEDNKLSLFIHDSIIRTEASKCNVSIINPNFKALFVIFDLIQFGDDLIFQQEFCPLIFYKADLSVLELKDLTARDFLQFNDFKVPGFDLMSTIDRLRILESFNAIVSKKTINEYVCDDLFSVEFLNTRLSRIEDDAFLNSQKIRVLIFQLDDFGGFIRSSSNQWFNSLNTNVTVNVNDSQSIQENLAKVILMTISTQLSGENYTFPDSDLQNWQNFPYQRFVFPRIIVKAGLECTSTLRYLFSYAQYYPVIGTLNTTSTYKCFLPSTTLSPASTTSSNNIQNYCPELPYCFCESRLKIKCENFDAWSQLNFSLLNNGPQEDRRRIFDIEFKPTFPIMLDNTLKLAKIEIVENIILRNLDGFDLLANPFFDSAIDNKLSLFIHESFIRTEASKCNVSIITSNFKSLFEIFDFIQFGDDLIFSSEFCPLIFYKADLSILEVKDILRNDYLQFNNFKVPGFDLMSTVDRLRILESFDAVISKKMINEYVCDDLFSVEFLNTRLGKIEDDAFIYSQKIKVIIFQLDNFAGFIRSSTNQWLQSLNTNVTVNVNDPQSIQDNIPKILLMTISTKLSGESYTFPNSDLQYWQNFPYQRFVFPRILVDENIECTSTLRYLLSYAPYYPFIGTLNTTSTYKCLQELSTTTRITTTTGTNFCPELPYCFCAQRTSIKCENFNTWSQLNFSLLNNEPDEPKRLIFNFELNPKDDIMLTNELKLTKIDITDVIILRNLDGFDLLANPFNDVVLGNKLSLYLHDSVIRTEASKCNVSIITANYRALFSMFDFIQFGDDLIFDPEFCPLIFHKADLSILEVKDIFSRDYLQFNNFYVPGFDLMSTIDRLRILESYDAIITKKMLNEYVCDDLFSVELLNTRLAKIEDDAFTHTQKIKVMIFQLEDLAGFIRSSSNLWMKMLNKNVFVDVSNQTSILENLPKVNLLTISTRLSGESYTFPDSDLQYWQNFPVQQFVFPRILVDENIECTSTLRYLLSYVKYYPVIGTLNTTSTYKCLIDTSSTPSLPSTSQITRRTTTSGEFLEYCEELAPYCTCPTRLVISCTNFTRWNQLNFNLLNNEPDEPKRRIFELELSPRGTLMLDDTLKLTKIEIYQRITLRNIDGFDVTANPFKDSIANRQLFLYIYSSIIRTEASKCNISIITSNSNFTALFAIFDYIQFGEDIIFLEEFCPLIFYKADLSLVDVYDIFQEDYLKFNNFKLGGFNLNCVIDRLRILDSYDAIITQKMMNEYVFEELFSFELQNVRLIEISDDAFYHTQQLKIVIFQVENLAGFIKLSFNNWLKNFNRLVNVNISDPQSINDNIGKAILFTFNSRNSGQSYKYPNEDFDYWKTFPYDKFVFPRILADNDLECSNTLQLMLQYARFYPQIATLNTTSTYKCFLGSNTFSPLNSTTTKNPDENYCSELPYCFCKTRLEMKCENFDTWSQLNFSLLNNGPQEERRRLFDIEFKPKNQIMLDNTLKLTKIEIVENIVLRNIDGFDLLANPFYDSAIDTKLSLFIHDSIIRTETSKCNISIINSNFKSLFEIFDLIQFGDDLIYKEEFCPLIFYKADLSILELKDVNTRDFLQFNDFKVPGFDLMSTIDRLRILDSFNAVLSKKTINEYVCDDLFSIEFLDTKLSRIEDDAFVNSQKLKVIIFQVDDFTGFIQSTTNDWMKSLNINVTVNVNDPQSIQENIPRIILITFNLRATGENYTFPDSDLDKWRNFPYQRFVFPRITTPQNGLECTSTLKYLFQYSKYYPVIQTLNSTSTYKCFIDTTPPGKGGSSGLSTGAILGIVIPISVLFVGGLVGVGVYLYIYKFKGKVTPSSTASDQPSQPSPSDDSNETKDQSEPNDANDIAADSQNA